ncbi:MAG: ATP-binding protein [Gammaproteobacteria bacterium]|nr:ATP-binding protein [Gammaproteobacteria bacterium]
MRGDDDEFKALRRVLAELARRSDREKPYAFVGRRGERAHFQQRTEQLPPYDGGAGGTTLITGAPGAGKTALKDQAVADFKEAHPSAVEIKVPSDSEEPPHGGMRRFLRQVAHHLVASPDPSGPEGTASTEVKGDVNAGFVKGGTSETTTFDVFGNPATFQDVHASAVQRGKGQPRFGPSSCLLVTMDEAQNVKPGTWPAHLINQARLQDELPIQVRDLRCRDFGRVRARRMLAGTTFGRPMTPDLRIPGASRGFLGPASAHTNENGSHWGALGAGAIPIPRLHKPLQRPWGEHPRFRPWRRPQIAALRQHEYTSPMADLIDPNYVDDGELREQDQVSLDNYLAQGDRAKPSEQRGMPFFSGREAEISTFRRMADGIARGHKADATLVVEGPPGAGKSALLCQFLEEMRNLPAIGDPPRRWLPTFINGASALCPDETMCAVDEAIARQLATDTLNSSPDQSRAKAKALLEFLGGDRIDNAKSLAQDVLDRGVSAFGFSIQAKNRTMPSSLREVANLRNKDWGKWQIMLMVDEAQGITMRAPGAHPGALSDIHQGATPLNLTFCAFGLPGTLAALAEVGVSRMSKGHRIQLRGLDEASSTKVIERCFARYGVVDAEPWREAILERSANWPQHLSTYLTATLSAIRCHIGDTQELGAPPDDLIEGAIGDGDILRAEYYDGRIETLTEAHSGHVKCAKHIIPMLREADGQLPEDEISDSLASPPLSLDEGQIQTFLEAAKHSGFLAPGGRATLHLAIPTFAGYILNEEPPPVGEPAGDLEP